MVDEETSKGIGKLFLKLEGMLQQCAANLTEAQKKKLARILKEAQVPS